MRGGCLGLAGAVCPKCLVWLKGVGCVPCAGRYHAQTIANVREALKQSKRMCALALDTKGPEIRTGSAPPPAACMRVATCCPVACVHSSHSSMRMSVSDDVSGRVAL
jgi:hypothetical protein